MKEKSVVNGNEKFIMVENVAFVPELMPNLISVRTFEEWFNHNFH